MKSTMKMGVRCLFFIYSFLVLQAFQNINAGENMTTKDVKIAVEKKGVTELFRAVEDRDLDKIKDAVKKGVSINATNEEGEYVIDIVMKYIGYFQKEVEIVNYLIEQGIDVNHYSGLFGANLLHMAATDNTISTAKLLFEKGVNKMTLTDLGQTPLFFVRTKEMLDLFIKNKSSRLKDIDSEGNTLLHNAIYIDADLALIKAFLKEIDVNAKNNDGETVLINMFLLNTFSKESVEILDLLLKSRADVNVLTRYGASPLILALRNEKVDLIVIEKLVKAGADLNQKDDRGMQVIHYAATNKLANVKFLLKHGADINAVSDKHFTALIIATMNGRKDIVVYLLKNNAKPNIRNDHGKTALNYAREADNGDITMLLEDIGAEQASKSEIKAASDINKRKEAEEQNKKEAKVDDLKSAVKSKDIKQVTKYYVEEEKNEGSDELDLRKLATLTAQYGNLEILNFFEEKGLDITEQYNGLTLLGPAVFYNNFEIVRYLIKKGLDVNAVNTKGRSIYSLSANSSIEMINILLESGIKAVRENEKEIVNDALYYKNMEMVKYFTDQGYDLTTEFMNRKYTLFRLVRQEATEALGYLFDRGVDINSMASEYDDDSHELTLLHLAVSEDSQKVVDYMLSVGANPNARMYNEHSILSTAIKEGSINIVRALIKHGADVNSYIDSGTFTETPLYLAIQLRRIDVAKLLIKEGADVNFNSGFDSNTAIHEAAKSGFLDLIARMVSQGGDVSLLNKEKKSPLDLAIEFEHKATEAYLKKIAASKK